MHFDFDNAPRKFIDVETGEFVNIYADNVKEIYAQKLQDYFKRLSESCMQNKIKYVPVNVGADFEKILTTYLVEKQSFG